MLQNNMSNLGLQQASCLPNPITSFIGASFVPFLIANFLSLHLHSPETSGHSIRVADLVEKIAANLHLNKKKKGSSLIR